MSSKLYVGNLPFSATESEVHELFSQAGDVAEVALINDRMTGRPRGFAFVTMATPEAAQAAIDKLNGAAFGGRELKINEARPREERPDLGDRGPRQGGFRRSFDGPPRGEGGYRSGPRGGGGHRGGNGGGGGYRGDRRPGGDRQSRSPRFEGDFE